MTRDRVNTTDQVHASLLDAIVTGQLKPGSFHSVYKLADAFGVSRTPVREAVLRLADIGMVEIQRNRGIRIRGITVEDIREVFEMRLLLEVPATWYAALHGGEVLADTLRLKIADMRAAAEADDETAFMQHDRAFHAAITEVLGNKRLASGVAALRDATQAKGASTAHRSRGLADIADEHAPIIEAIVSGNPAAAARHMKEHLIQTGTLLMRQVADVSGETVPLDWPNRLQTG